MCKEFAVGDMVSINPDAIRPGLGRETILKLERLLHETLFVEKILKDGGLQYPYCLRYSDGSPVSGFRFRASSLCPANPDIEFKEVSDMEFKAVLQIS